MTSGRRLPFLALLLLHVFVAGLAPLADARTAHEGSATYLHVESDERPPCPTGHDHLLCQLCRHADSRFTAATPTACALQDRTVGITELSSPRTAQAAVPLGLPLGPRAPPPVLTRRTAS